MDWDLVESPEAPNMLTTIKDLSSLCASVSLTLTSVEWMPSIPVSLAVGGSVALAAGTMWLNNRSKNKVIGSLRQDLAQQVARGDALQKRLQKKDTAKSNRGNIYTLDRRRVGYKATIFKNQINMNDMASASRTPGNKGCREARLYICVSEHTFIDSKHPIDWTIIKKRTQLKKNIKTDRSIEKQSDKKTERQAEKRPIGRWEIQRESQKLRNSERKTLFHQLSDAYL